MTFSPALPEWGRALPHHHGALLGFICLQWMGAQPSDGEHPAVQDEKLITTGPLALLELLLLVITC